jgi:hypothetical protein
MGKEGSALPALSSIDWQPSVGGTAGRRARMTGNIIAMAVGALSAG